MINRHIVFFNVLNTSTDYLILNAGLIAGWRFNCQPSFGVTDTRHLLSVGLIYNLIWFLASSICKQSPIKDDRNTYHKKVGTFIVFVCLVCFIQLLSRGSEAYHLSWNSLFFALASLAFVLAASKTLFFLIIKNNWLLPGSVREVVIVGGGYVGCDVYKYFTQNPYADYKTVGFFDDDPANITNDVSYLGTTNDCIAYVMNNKVDEIFCTLPASDSSVIERLIADADKNLIRFKSVPGYYQHAHQNTSVYGLGHIPVISLRTEPLENVFNKLIKRLFDVVFSLFVIFFVFSWLCPILAIVIKLESKGPVFFTQARSGLNNDPFLCFKFRSMRVNKDSDTLQASRSDARTTRVGLILRKTGLDELPQFFNVLMGNMSVVGPRPHMISHTEQYANLIDGYMARHFIKPGITGWAQVNGLRGETKTVDAMLRRVEADVWYLGNWSFLLDVKIILLTARNLFRGDKNAY